MFISVVLVVLALAASGDEPLRSDIPHCFNEDSMRDVKRTATALAEFRKLKPGISRDKVISTLGQPSYICGSAVKIDVYVIDGGREVWITYIDGLTAWAGIADQDGQNSEALFGT